MKIYADQFLSIYFGDAHAQLKRELLMNTHGGNSLLSTTELAGVKTVMNIADLYVMRQEHGIQGVVVTTKNSKILQDTHLIGDFLITDVPHSGLMVYTADCLPLVIYDPISHAVGLCHAGWRGSVSRVACIMLHEMMFSYGTNPRFVQVFFGPSAHPCCYSVSHDFKEHFEGLWYRDALFEPREGKLFFDLTALNRLQLESCGVPQEAFCYNYSACTIENPSFCSARRDSKDGSTARQATIVSLAG